MENRKISKSNSEEIMKNMEEKLVESQVEY